MKKFKTAILLITVLLGFTAVQAQQRTVVRGRVVDKLDEAPIIGATIGEYDSEERTVGGAATNVSGDFVYTMKDPSNKLMVSMIGYKGQEIKVDPSKSILVEMESDDVAIGEVVVKAEARTSGGLTNVDERDKATSSVKVDLMEMADAGITSAEDALQGKVSGLDIISASGDPGSGSQIVIRGLSSMGNNRPLIVIDGVPQFVIGSNFDLSSADEEDISNLINIALQDIKSIEVLKDAGSTAIYGSRGADGVLLIETKKGRMGKVQFDYTYKGSMNVQPPPIPMLNGDEYVMLQLEQWHNNEGIFDIPSEIAYDPDFVDFHNYSVNTDWVDALSQVGRTDDHYFSVQGGGDKTRFFTSYSWVDEGGTTINTGNKRFSTRVNLDYFISKAILFQIKFDYSVNMRENNVEFGNGGNKKDVRELAFLKAPNMSIWEYDTKGQRTGEYFTPINSYQDHNFSYVNPVAVAHLGFNDKTSNNVKNTFLLQYRVNDWLTFRETVSFQYAGEKSKSFLPYDAIGQDWLSSDVNWGLEKNALGSSIRTESQLTFASPFKSEVHDFSGALTWITEQTRSEELSIQSSNTASTDIYDPAANAQLRWLWNGQGETRTVRFPANLNYKYLDKYMLQTTFSADAFSAFGSDNRWGYFTGIGLAWRFSDEPFLDAWYFLDESKLRFSWGTSGRQPKDAYARFATYETTQNGTYNGRPAISPTSVQLSNLGWENIATTDIGLELSFFKGRIYLEGDVYRKLTTNILFEKYDIPAISGFDRLRYFNGGEMLNIGWEIMADAKIIRTKDLLWSFNFNTSRNINSFSKLPENFNPEQNTAIGNGDYPQLVQEGAPIGSFFGFQYGGVFPSDEDAVAKNEDGTVMKHVSGGAIPFSYVQSYTFKGGDPIYIDQNYDGVIDLNDVVWIGDSNPDFIGGFGTSVKYKQFDFSASFHYRLGFDIINMNAMQTEGMRDRNNQSKAVLWRWRIQGQDVPGMLPRAYKDHPASNLGSDRYVERGDYVRLNNLKVSYQLSKDVCQRFGIRKANFALSARKLFTFTNYSGQDPEVGQDASNPFWIGVDRAKTPPPKVYTLTLSIGI